MARRPSRSLSRLLVLIAPMAVASCIAPTLPTATVTPPLVVRVGTAAGIRTVPLEEYVLGSVLAEVSPVGETPATVARIFEVQSILARSYVLAHIGRHRTEGFDLCDSTHCQLYDPARIRTSRFTEIARQSVLGTKGVVLVFAGRPAEALFHADCGGHTAAADLVWGGAAVPYLRGIVDDVPSVAHRAWQFDVTSERLRDALDADSGTDVGRRLDGIAITDTDGSGRADRLEVRGERTHPVRGEDLRAILNRTFGERAILSTRFSVTRSGGSYQFQGTGFGHGVGLCQVGAAARARRGDTAGAILAAYFPGAMLAVTGSAPQTDAPRRFPGSLLNSP